MQHFYNLDTDVNNEFLTLGSLKLTTSRFYSGCGNTPQTKGINPDIQLPDDEKYIVSGERNMYNPIPTEETEKTICQQEVNNVANLTALQEASAKRVSASKPFKVAESKAIAIKEHQEATSIPLNYKAYKNHLANKFKPKQYDDKIFAKIKDFEVTVAPQELKGRSSVETSRDERWIKRLESDPYVQECLLST